MGRAPFGPSGRIGGFPAVNSARIPVRAQLRNHMGNNVFHWLAERLATHRWQYRALQLSGWGGYTLLTFVGSFFWVENHWLHTGYIAAATASGVLLSEVMRRGFQRLWNKPPALRLFGSLGVVALAAVLWAAIKFAGSAWLYGTEKGEHPAVLAVYWFSYSFLILMTWAALYYGIKYYQTSLAQQAKALRAESMAHQAQLKMLRYQLNPHFLFNTLNAISTLILDSQGRTANDMVSRLSQFLRHSLDNDPMQKVTLAKEVEALMLYLDIEKVRFDDRLAVNVDLDGDSPRALVPSLLLQPLVENAIKYAISQREWGGEINIKARVFAGELLLEVSDNGPGVSEEVLAGLGSGQGVGIRNTCERLRALYGPEQKVRFRNRNEGGLAVHIRIPYQQESRHEWQPRQTESHRH
ncbi:MULTISPECIES: sensor histidine kinase [Microbulbifer]|uniref:sensor histidine kinase n=1 Tax=Microbulbifer TaxID=48073 RepID=UPI001E57B373|nr:histidine kinase [Microbulbifer sp. YPW16]UHQ57120.1 histidine kinase [Microbulbifer sp. YPW16]